jgi:anti-sigma regulatory factor (Ser/Thr protein kinase)
MEKRGRGLFHITEKLVDKLEFTQSPKGGLAVKVEKNIPQEF